MALLRALALWSLLTLALPASAQTASPAPKEPAMSLQASGSFDVDLKPESAADATVGRFSLNKKLHGDLDGVSVGEMLGIRSAVEGSAGYVAMERVTGTLNGKQGSFALQHSGTMNRGQLSAKISVIPDSGTGALTGISGEMTIDASGGSHTYVFRYALPAPPK